MIAIFRPAIADAATGAATGASVAASGFVAAPHDDCSAPRPGVCVNVSGVRDRSGKLEAELYSATRADFLQNDETLPRAGKVFRRIVTFVPARQPSLPVPVPASGRYAIIVIQQCDGASKFNSADDGVALPGHVRIGLRKPIVDGAVVVVADHVTTVDARMQLPRGVAGFKPLVQ